MNKQSQPCQTVVDVLYFFVFPIICFVYLHSNYTEVKNRCDFMQHNSHKHTNTDYFSVVIRFPTGRGKPHGYESHTRCGFPCAENRTFQNFTASFHQYIHCAKPKLSFTLTPTLIVAPRSINISWLTSSQTY